MSLDIAKELGELEGLSVGQLHVRYVDVFGEPSEPRRVAARGLDLLGDRDPTGAARRRERAARTPRANIEECRVRYRIKDARDAVGLPERSPSD